jgi:exodeoxyribonuclease V alpha subunit
MTTLMAHMAAALEDGRLRPLEMALADWCLRHGGSQPVALAMALAARAVHDGHSCWRLPVSGPALPGEAPLLDANEFAESMRASRLVGEPGMARPLILEGERLYLHRYHDYEVRLARCIRALAAQPAERVDIAPLLADGGLFDYGWVGPQETHWQAVAAFVALRQRFVVVSGGPGTGKTYAVLRLMRLMIESALARGGRAPVIRMAASTGKAAARMVASAREGLAGMPIGQAVRAHIPEEAATLHRLLGLSRDSTRPRHDATNPLPLDVLIVDEASMVDLPMMTKLIEALPDHARLVLLGDRYQLASVESGSVLAEICDAAGVNHFSYEQVAAGGALFPPGAGTVRPGALDDHVVTLQTSHRFRPDSPIGRMAAAVNAGDAAALQYAIEHGGDDVQFESSGGQSRLRALVQRSADLAAPLFERGLSPEHALSQLDRHRILTATRIGASGSEALNRAITAELAARFRFDPERRWYPGRAVLVTENDHRARLFNGDTGVALPDADGRLRVYFAGDGGVRAFLPTALPAHETAWAMTVHKSQGSEFDTLTLVLPDADMPVLTRELIYTGITRARVRISLWSSAALLSAAVSRKSVRESGLASRLK